MLCQNHLSLSHTHNFFTFIMGPFVCHFFGPKKPSMGCYVSEIHTGCLFIHDWSNDDSGGPQNSYVAPHCKRCRNPEPRNENELELSLYMRLAPNKFFKFLLDMTQAQVFRFLIGIQAGTKRKLVKHS